MTKISIDINYHPLLFPKKMIKSMLEEGEETRKTVKCKKYFWEFCYKKEPNKDNNRERCKKEKCKLFKNMK